MGQSHDLLSASEATTLKNMGKLTRWIMWNWWYNHKKTKHEIRCILWDILYVIIMLPDSYYVIKSYGIQGVYDRELFGWKAPCHKTIILDSFLWLVCSILYFPRALLHLDNYIMPDLVFAPNNWHQTLAYCGKQYRQIMYDVSMAVCAPEQL